MGVTSESSEPVSVRDALMDSEDWQYTVAGHLVGTDWLLPEYEQELDTVKAVRQETEKSTGHSMKYPEVIFRHSNIRFAVPSFIRRIDPTDVGDIEPAGGTAEQIVKIQKEEAWRNIILQPK